MQLLILAVVLMAPLTEPPEGSYAAIVEINHVVDSNGNDRFTQLIYREGNGLIMDWRYLQTQSMVPTGIGRYKVAVWRENGHTRMLWCSELRETWTRTDPERDEAQWRPAFNRNRLFGAKDP